MRPPVFTFEVVPVREGAFEPKLLDVPSLSGEGFAARRAWWTVFHLLGPQGFEPEDFQVFEFSDEGGRGREVTSGGLA
jgi:hypothetical protein